MIISIKKNTLYPFVYLLLLIYKYSWGHEQMWELSKSWNEKPDFSVHLKLRSGAESEKPGITSHCSKSIQQFGDFLLLEMGSTA